MDPTQSTETTQTQTETPLPTPAQNMVPQERFNEVIASTHELRRQVEQSNAMNQELIAQLAQSVRTNMPAPVAPAIPEGVDPAMAQWMQSIMDKQTAMIEQKVTQAVGSVRAQQEQMAFHQAAQGEDPEVVQLAQKLQADWRRLGHTGWTSEDALVYAGGIVRKKAASQQARTRPNGDGSDHVTTNGGMAPNPVAANRLPPIKSDEELQRMTVNQRDAYLLARVGDSDIQY